MKYRLLPALVAILALPAPAQNGGEKLSGAQYVETQLTLLTGVTEMLNIPSLADAPDEVAAGIQQLWDTSGYWLHTSRKSPRPT